MTSQLKLEEKLQHSLEPPYIVLLSYIGQHEGGVKFIVDLRKDLLVSGNTNKPRSFTLHKSHPGEGTRL